MAKSYADRAAAVLADLSYAVKTDVGVKRSENQDNYAIIEGQGFRFFCVADGMGGAKSGGLASQLAVDSLRSSLSQEYISRYDLSQAVERANKLIFDSSQESPDKQGMGTTLVGLCFTGIEFYIVNVGDSRAYRIRNEKIEQLTVDHSLVQELIKAGAIKSEQRDANPISHMLTRSLGPSAQVQVDCVVASKTVCRGDIFLLCSDGLYNLVSDEEILNTVLSASIEQASERLVDLANKHGGNDNITVVLVKAGSTFPEYDPELEQREINQSHPTDTIEFDSVKLAKALRARRRRNIVKYLQRHKTVLISALSVLLLISVTAQYLISRQESLKDSAAKSSQEAIPEVSYEGQDFSEMAPVSWNMRLQAELASGKYKVVKPVEPKFLELDEELFDPANLSSLTEQAEALQQIRERLLKLDEEQKKSDVAVEQKFLQQVTFAEQYQFAKFSELLKIADEMKAQDSDLGKALTDFQGVSWKYLQAQQEGGVTEADSNLVELRTVAVERVREQVRNSLMKRMANLDREIDSLLLKNSDLSRQRTRLSSQVARLEEAIKKLH
jgi:serine/threonine protein phosphatase PrpC